VAGPRSRVGVRGLHSTNGCGNDPRVVRALREAHLLNAKTSIADIAVRKIRVRLSTRPLRQYQEKEQAGGEHDRYPAEKQRADLEAARIIGAGDASDNRPSTQYQAGDASDASDPKQQALHTLSPVCFFARRVETGAGILSPAIVA